MSDEPKRWLWAWIVWALLGPLVFYPLSAGPAWWVCAQTEPEWVMRVYYAAYAPLTWACDRNETVNNMLTCYGGWWTPTNNVPMPLD